MAWPTVFRPQIKVRLGLASRDAGPKPGSSATIYCGELRKAALQLIENTGIQTRRMAERSRHQNQVIAMAVKVFMSIIKREPDAALSVAPDPILDLAPPTSLDAGVGCCCGGHINDAAATSFEKRARRSSR